MGDWLPGRQLIPLGVHLAAVESRLNMTMGSSGSLVECGRRRASWVLACRVWVSGLPRRALRELSWCSWVTSGAGAASHTRGKGGEATRATRQSRSALSTCILASLTYQGDAGEVNPASPQSWMVVATGHRLRPERAMQGLDAVASGRL